MRALFIKLLLLFAVADVDEDDVEEGVGEAGEPTAPLLKSVLEAVREPPPPVSSPAVEFFTRDSIEEDDGALATRCLPLCCCPEASLLPRTEPLGTDPDCKVRGKKCVSMLKLCRLYPPADSGPPECFAADDDDDIEGTLALLE
jgi:hypothetical protein